MLLILGTSEFLMAFLLAWYLGGGSKRPKLCYLVEIVAAVLAVAVLGSVAVVCSCC